jgi:hypothetical protein
VVFNAHANAVKIQGPEMFNSHRWIAMFKAGKINEGEASDPITEATDMNDPVLMAFRAAKAELPNYKPKDAKIRRLSFDKYMDLLDDQSYVEQELNDLRERMAQTLRDMEQEAKPEGGSMADKYGRKMMRQEAEYLKLKAKKAKIDARVDKQKYM